MLTVCFRRRDDAGRVRGAAVSFIEIRRENSESVWPRVSPRRDAATGNPYPLRIREVYLDPFDGRILGTRHWGAARLDRAHLVPF